MSPALRAGSAAALSHLACCAAALARLPSSAPLRVRTPPPTSARGGPDNKKSPHRWELKI